LRSLRREGLRPKSVVLREDEAPSGPHICSSLSPARPVTMANPPRGLAGIDLAKSPLGRHVREDSRWGDAAPGRHGAGWLAADGWYSRPIHWCCRPWALRYRVERVRALQRRSGAYKGWLFQRQQVARDVRLLATPQRGTGAVVDRGLHCGRPPRTARSSSGPSAGLRRTRATAGR